jgi:hypothetical protein
LKISSLHKFLDPNAVSPATMITDKPRFPIREMLCHGWLPSFLKCALYRVRGYKIGHRVRIGFGSVIRIITNLKMGLPTVSRESGN